MEAAIQTTRAERELAVEKHDDAIDRPAPPAATLELDFRNATAALEHAEALVRHMAKKCAGREYVSTISGRRYPKVEWWTTVGSALGLFPVEASCKRLKREGEICYESVVEVRRGEHVITRASAICSSREKNWKSRDEYAVRSMATTRATGKAYRIGLSWLAVMAGLCPTPAEEMPPEEGSRMKTGGTAEKAKSNTPITAFANRIRNARDREQLEEIGLEIKSAGVDSPDLRQAYSARWQELEAPF